jgi:hypothetical protein
MSLIAHTVSSMGVSGSGRWQNSRSTNSRPRRCERAVDGVHEVLAVERVLHVDHAVVDAPEDLGGDHVAVALPPELGDGIAHDLLALAARVGLGVVEEVHPALLGSGELQSLARPVSTWVPKVTHEPNDRALTWRPERPRRR